MRLLDLVLVPLLSFSFASPSKLWDALQIQPAGRVENAGSWSWKDCGLPTDVAHINSISISPDPPQRGKDLTVTVIGSVAESVEEGAFADVNAKMGRITILKKRFDLCEEARTANTTTQCPVAQGEYTIVETGNIPREIAPATYYIHTQASTADEKPLLCLDITVNFPR